MKSGGNFEAVVLYQFAAVGLEIILDQLDARHGGGNAGPAVGEKPVMCEELSHVHDFNVGGFGFPELALLQGGKRGGFFGFHAGTSLIQKLRGNEHYSLD
jgi:hypothetical protein